MTAEEFASTVLAQLFAYGYVEAANLLNDKITFPNFPKLGAVATERAKIQPVSKVSEGHFGWSVALDEYNLLVGAPSENQYSTASGSAYFYSIETAAEGILSSQQTVILEHAPDTNGKIGVQFFRLGDLSSELNFHFATSDGTAVGISQGRLAHCIGTALPFRTGADCGDFVHTSGWATFNPGQSNIKIFVTIMDDFCQEPELENFFMHISVPGGPTLNSQYFRSIIRIDDNDLGYRLC
jgi:hypothetical protein